MRFIVLILFFILVVFSQEASNIDKFLRISQNVSRVEAVVGQIITYRITVSNIHSNAVIDDIDLVNVLPARMRYISSSLKRSSFKLSREKQKIVVSVGSLASGETTEFSFNAKVRARAFGVQENISYANGNIVGIHRVDSFITKSSVNILQQSIFGSKAWVFGYAYVDINHNNTYDEGQEPTIPGVKVYMEDGRYAITDNHGRYSFDNVDDGTHVLALDLHTLPPQFALTKKGRNGRTRFAHIKGATPWRTDFNFDFNRHLYRPLQSTLQIQYENKSKLWQETISYTFLFERKTRAVSILDKWNLKQLFMEEFPAKEIELTIIADIDKEQLQELSLLKLFLEQRFGFGENLMITSMMGIPYNLKTNEQPIQKPHIKELFVTANPHQVSADGKTEPTIFIHALDQNGELVNESGFLTITTTESKIINQDHDEEKEGTQIPMVGGVGMCILEAQQEVKTATLTVEYKNITKKINIDYVPYFRDWVIIGIAEGTAGIETASKQEKLYVDGRVAFFAKGKILGKYLLTALYDSGKKQEQKLFKNVQENQFYSVYYDPNLSGYEVNTNSKVYVKLEKDENYIMYGDYNVNFNNHLVQYQHAFRGVAAQFKTQYLDVKAFGSKATQVLVHDEIRGQGISGFYQLSRKNVVTNSIRVVVETRSQFNPKEVISVEEKQIYRDYDVNFERGRVLFDFPISPNDLLGNPVFIVATYTSQEASSEEIIWGAQANVKLLAEKVLFGSSYIQETKSKHSNRIYGSSIQIKPMEGISIDGNIAHTTVYDSQKDLTTRGLAYSFATKFQWGISDTTIGYHSISDDYYSAVLPNIATGSEKIFIESQLKASENVTVQMNASQEKMNKEQFRQFGLHTLIQNEYTQNMIGYQLVEQRKGNKKQYAHVASVGSRVKVDDGLVISAERHQVFTNEKFSDKPKTVGNISEMDKNIKQDFRYKTTNINERLSSKTILGAEVVPNDWLNLWVNQEFEDEGRLESSRTFAGINLQIHETTQVYAKYGFQHWVDDVQNQALLGLKTDLAINEWLSGHFFAERLHTFTEENPEDFITNGFHFKLMTLKHTGDFRSEMRYQGGDYQLLFTPSLTSYWDESIVTFWSSQFTPKEQFSVFENTNLFGVSYRPHFLQNVNLVGKTQLNWARNNDVESQAITFVSTLDLHIRLPKSMDLMLHYAYKYEEVEDLSQDPVEAMTDLLALRWLYEINNKWDVGFHMGTVNEYESEELDYGYGVEMGYRVANDLWLSLGYNIKGVTDNSFGDSNFLNEGVFISMRFKFDEKILDTFSSF
ncbi:hypothetical protein [Candidatus Uabimicrobium sp. HlEnr_7]|uniref:hypothetical protein n=1 Tax=Candidatus Uabimicrobium helgolandensis TaxID=3095367 RepID=UPI003558A971